MKKNTRSTHPETIAIGCALRLPGLSGGTCDIGGRIWRRSLNIATPPPKTLLKTHLSYKQL
jgi:uncharacterized membrane protein